MCLSVFLWGMCIKETNWFTLDFQNSACGLCNSILQSLLLFWKFSQGSLLLAGLRFRTIDPEGLVLPLSAFLLFFSSPNIAPNIYVLKVKRSNSSRKWSSIFNFRLGVVQTTAVQAPSHCCASDINLDLFSPWASYSWNMLSFVSGDVVWLYPPLGIELRLQQSFLFKPEVKLESLLLVQIRVVLHYILS